LGQEFLIKSTNLEDKIRQLLPSQGGAQAGVDLSASTTIIPIVDLTESAEGSNLRVDLQTALSHDTATVYDVENTSTTVINTTGYWRIIGTATAERNSGTAPECEIIINDGFSSKTVYAFTNLQSSVAEALTNSFDFNVFLSAGDSLVVSSNLAGARIIGSVRQIADISGNLINP